MQAADAIGVGGWKDGAVGNCSSGGDGGVSSGSERVFAHGTLRHDPIGVYRGGCECHG